MVPALACIKWFDCCLPGAVVSQGTSRPNAENCSGFPPPTRQSASIEAELLDLTSIYSEFNKYLDCLNFNLIHCSNFEALHVTRLPVCQIQYESNI